MELWLSPLLLEEVVRGGFLHSLRGSTPTRRNRRVHVKPGWGQTLRSICVSRNVTALRWGSASTCASFRWRLQSAAHELLWRSGDAPGVQTLFSNYTVRLHIKQEMKRSAMINDEPDSALNAGKDLTSCNRCSPVRDQRWTTWHKHGRTAPSKPPQQNPFK